MSQQAKKKGKGGGSASLSRQPSSCNAAEAEERARDEMTSLEAIFADDFKAIAVDDPGKPLHFQIRVRPLPNEPDAQNHCAVLLDAMLSAAPLPLIVLRKGQGKGTQNDGQTRNCGTLGCSPLAQAAVRADD